MRETIAKGRLFRITVAVDDKMLETMRRCPDLTMKAMQEGADYWHTGILPKHFEPSGHSSYGYATRSRNYLKSKHGKPDLVNAGSLRRDLKAKVAFRDAGKVLEMKMFARVLNFCPTMPENSDDKYVKHKKGRGYPNLKREIKAITDEETKAVAAVVTNRLEMYFGDTEGRESDD